MISEHRVGTICRWFNAFTFFFLALALKLAYCLVFSERQLCGLNDSGNLELGSVVANAFRAGNVKMLGLPMDSSIFHGATALDALINSGPLHPLYLSLMYSISGLVGTLDFAKVNCTPLVVGNCVLDAIACACIFYTARLAFNRRTAYVAAALAMFYPPSFFNCLHCYPETLGYTLTSMWLCIACSLVLRHRPRRLTYFLHSALGLVSGLLMLCVPALMLLPIFAGGLLALYLVQARKTPNAVIAVPTQSEEQPVSSNEGSDATAESTIAHEAAKGGTAEGVVAQQPIAGTSSKNSNADFVRYGISAAVFLIGFSIVIAPWFWAQKEAVGSVTVVPTASFSSQLWTGNFLSLRGWPVMPYINFWNQDFAITARNFLRSIASAPVHYIVLTFSKFPRLGAGTWNDYQIPVFGVDYIFGNVFHCLILLSAFIGASLSTLRATSWRWSRTFACAIPLCAVVVYHLLFCLLTPVSRNEYTALPAIIVLSASGLYSLFSRASNRSIGILFFAFSTLFFYHLLSANSFVPFIIGITLSDKSAQGADIAINVSGWIIVTMLALAAVRRVDAQTISSATDMLKVGSVTCILILIACSIVDLRWREWDAVLRSNHDACLQIIDLPDASLLPELSNLGDSKLAFVLLDVSSQNYAPPIVASINDVPNVGPPIPWMMIKEFDTETFAVLAKQAKGMGRGWQTFRQWWAVPVPLSALRFGKPNVISIMLKSSAVPIACKVYGQYGFPREHQNKHGSVAPLPSMHSLSWEKGFATYEAGDIRLPVASVMQGKVVGSSISNGSSLQQGDLSYEHGLQGGVYRVRLTVPLRNSFPSVPRYVIDNSTVPKTNHEPGATITKDKSDDKSPTGDMIPFLHEDAITVMGTDEHSQLLCSQSIPASVLQAGVLLLIQAELRGFKNATTADLDLVFVGKDDSGQEITVSAPWQPDCIQVSDDWKPYSFVTFLPDSLAHAKDLKFELRLHPYDMARLIAHPNGARAQDVAVRHVSLEIRPPLGLGTERDRDWMLF